MYWTFHVLQLAKVHDKVPKSIKKYYEVLLHTTKYVKVLQCITKFYKALRSTTPYCKVLQGTVLFGRQNGWRQAHTKSSVWASHWLVAQHAFYRQILSLAYRFSSTWNFGPRPGTNCTIYHTMYKHIQMTNNTSFWVPRMLGPWPVAAQDQEQLSKTHGAARGFTNERCNFFWKIALHLLTLGSIHRPNGQMICRAVSTGLILEHALLWGVQKILNVQAFLPDLEVQVLFHGVLFANPASRLVDSCLNIHASAEVGFVQVIWANAGCMKLKQSCFPKRCWNCPNKLLFNRSILSKSVFLFISLWPNAGLIGQHPLVAPEFLGHLGGDWMGRLAVPLNRNVFPCKNLQCSTSASESRNLFF